MAPTFKISNSQINLFETCERKYYHKYIQKTHDDIDYEKKDFFSYGSIMHEILEMFTKNPKSKFERVWETIKLEPNYKEFFELHNDENTKIRRKVEVSTYGEQEIKGKMYLHLKLFLEWFEENVASKGGKVHASELKIETETCILIIDLIIEVNGFFYIIDFKTHANMNLHDFTAPRLHRDSQLALYASHAEIIAQHIGIKVPFGGVCYLEFNKTMHSMNEKETHFEQLTNRILSEKGAETLIRMLLIENINIDYQYFMDNFKKQYSKISAMREGNGEVTGTQNFRACVDNFSGACQYFSQCHGNISRESPLCIASYGIKATFSNKNSLTSFFDEL